MRIELTRQDLTLDEIEAVAAGGESVTLSDKAQGRVRAFRQVLEDILRRDEVVYGINTGFGNFRNVVIPQADPETLDAVVAMLNAGVHPVVPQKGSVGASSDLAPLAHVALVLIGEGEAFYRDERLSGGAALERAGLSPVRLHPKDGLALINGTQVISALLAGAVSLAGRLVRSAAVIGALTLDTLLGAVHARLREDVPPYEHDRAHYPDIAAANEIVGSGELVHVVEQTLGTEGALS